jgi:hypothetical protein
VARRGEDVHRVYIGVGMSAGGAQVCRCGKGVWSDGLGG